MRWMRGLSVAAVVALGALLGACHDPNVGNGHGAFKANPKDVDFGAVALGRDRIAEISLTNNGRVPYSVYEATTSVPNVSIEGFETLRLEAGETKTLKLRFAPAVEGKVSGVVSIVTDETADTYQVNFDGLGVKALAELDTQALDYGQVEIETSKVKEVHVRNPTQVETSVRFTISGDGADEYSSSEANQDLVLAPGEDRAIPIAFKPIRLAMGVATATFDVCPACDPVVVDLTGEGIADNLDVTPTRVDFGRVALGAVATQTISVTNLGSQPVPLSSAGTKIIKDDSGVFSVVSAPDTVLQRGQSATLTVQFAPTQTGTATGMVHIDATAENAPKGVTLGMSGEGGASCVTFLPKALDFGTVPEGMSATRRLDVMNRCTYDAQIVQNDVTTTVGGYFSVAQTGMVVVPAGKVTSMKVTFTPKPGSSSSKGVIQFKVQEQGAFSSPQVMLSGESKVFQPCNWALLPSTLDFGAVPVGSTATLGLALKNTGTEQCFVGGMQLASGSDQAFTATPVNSMVLDPGQTTTLLVTFKPTSTGLYAGLAEGWVNHPTDNHPTAVVKGNGVIGCFALQPTDVEFGVTKLTCGQKQRTVVGFNNCTAPVSVSSVMLDAPATTEFTLTQSASAPYSINPGQQVSFTVSYQPVDDGDDSAALRVTADGIEYVAGIVGSGRTKPTQTDVFVQDTQAKVDVLFVIDNSGSMMEEQQSIGANFAAFLSEAQAQGVDYQIGVTTTGIEPSPGGWSVCPGGVDGGEAGRLFPVVGSTPRIITPTTPNAASVFATNINVGWCHWNEQGIEAAYRALSAPLVNSVDDPSTSQPNDGNAGFLRPDAKLAVVFVSDEDDYSTQTVAFYKTFFQSLKSDPSDLTLNAIVGPQNLSTCPTASSSGTRYISLANATGGAVESICTQDWAKSLEKIGKNTFGMKRNFKLSQVPEDAAQIEVFVNGQQQSNGYVYDAATNSVVFDENSTPGAGSVIEITYPLGC